MSAKTNSRAALRQQMADPYVFPAVAGIRLGCAKAFSGRADLTAVEIAPGAAVAGIFTQNVFAAAPVQVCRRHLNTGAGIRGIVINAGTANAGTGAHGLRDARTTCRLFADILKCRPENILPFSTGVIGEYLPINQMARGLKKCAADLASDNWRAAACAIMTGDTVPKTAFQIVRCNGKSFSVAGIAKGSGMIHPRMATMLALVATDAAVPHAQLTRWQRAVAGETFNAIIVDGETSTNDSFALIATGKSGECPRGAAGKIKNAIAAVCKQLAEAIVQDGEGANKFIEIAATGGKTRTACRKVAEAVARSPLVRMAIATGKADAGRLLAAAGNGGCNAQKLHIKVGNVHVIRNGGALPRRETIRADKILSGDKAKITVQIGNSPHSWTVKTCDMTRRYVDKFGMR